MAIKFISVDVETTGRDPKRHQIIEFGAVLDDWNDPKPISKLPRFQAFIRHPTYNCEAYAAWLNQDIMGKLGGALDLEEGEQICTPGEAFSRFYDFLLEHGYKPTKSELIRFVPAGKNFHSFDGAFLIEMPEWTSRFRTFRRCLDPGILFLDVNNDDEPPDTETCLQRAGIVEDVSHRAVDDAIQIIKMLRYKLLER